MAPVPRSESGCRRSRRPPGASNSSVVGIGGVRRRTILLLAPAPCDSFGSLGLFSVDSEAGPYYQEVGCVRDLCRVAAATNLHLTMYTPNWGWALQAKADISVLSSSTATRCHGLVAR